MQVTGLGAIAGGARRNASGSGLHPRNSSRTTTNPGNGPAPNPSGPPWEAVRRQQSVPGEMLLAPAAGRGGRGGSSGLLQAALSDSWPRRLSGARFYCRRERGEGGGKSQACGNSYNEEGVEGTLLSLPANTRVRIDTLNLLHPPKTQREHRGNNNLFK